jgi:hypothetical protein
MPRVGGEADREADAPSLSASERLRLTATQRPLSAWLPLVCNPSASSAPEAARPRPGAVHACMAERAVAAGVCGRLRALGVGRAPATAHAPSLSTSERLAAPERPTAIERG